MSSTRRLRGWILALVASVALVVAGCAPSGTGTPAAAPTPAASTTPTETPTVSPSVSPTPTPSPSTAPTPTASATSSPSASPTPTPSTSKPSPSATPTAKAGPALMQHGATGSEVKDLQARLKQIGWFSGAVTGYYGDATTAAVRGFQAKRGLPVTGAVDRTTLNRLYAMTRTPTAAELTNAPPAPSASGLDPRCMTGRALCISKTTRTMVWVIDGKPQSRFAVRFGSELTPTREGQFQVEWKSRDHVSTIYHTPMPFAMFFSGGQAVHYSPDFAANGYNGSSHGCVNVRDYNGIARLFDQVRVGDKVIVYR
ncbi:L,D-transpeptidase catalytic domain [Raineyella antarctica]|uniref:L,D-transpeptidase catalytic domain n=1 Tax=Raineyella antarctica TaxID=1577474 RepID=A0A1G6GNH5_9ACTN|nr:L,D-transpeptidase family protein [Raineyella antarctica]SDB83484.1 L,D-transpeptidase catalytic domain [Raineyella antarctica]